MLSKFACAMGGALMLSYTDRQPSKSCGIVGYIGNKFQASDVIMHGLEQVQNRGYDSAGIATVTPGNEIRITKCASNSLVGTNSLARVKEMTGQHGTAQIGIGHTRWATHGAKTDVNSHPHCDAQDRVALVHNGIIDNSFELRQFLATKGLHPKSETDTEIISLLIGYQLDKGHGLKTAVARALAKCSGSWGIAVVSKDEPDKIVAARQGSPLLVGIGPEGNEFFIGSERAVFSKYTNRFIEVNEGEIITLSRNKQITKDRIQEFSADEFVGDKGTYLHWMLKEIDEEPRSMSRALNFGGRLNRDRTKLGGLEPAQDKLLAIKNMLLLGCGTSMYACKFGELIFKELQIFDTVRTQDGSEMFLHDLPHDSPGCIAVSQSGESKDLLDPVKMLLEHNVTMTNVVNVVGSSIARIVGSGVYMNAGREMAVAATKSFMNSCVCLVEVALWYSAHKYEEEQKEKRIEIVNQLMRLPLLAGLVLTHNRNQAQIIAQEIKDANDIYVLGKGLAVPIAMEGALKIKEVTTIHAEGDSASQYRHGLNELIREDTPVILIVLNDENKEAMRQTVKAVKQKKAKTIVITTDPYLVDIKDVDHIITIEENGVLSPLLAVIPLQLLAYYTAIAKGLNPDNPRNLAKTVTTK